MKLRKKSFGFRWLECACIEERRDAVHCQDTRTAQRRREDSGDFGVRKKRSPRARLLRRWFYVTHVWCARDVAKKWVMEWTRTVTVSKVKRAARERATFFSARRRRQCASSRAFDRNCIGDTWKFIERNDNIWVKRVCARLLTSKSIF